MEPYTGLKVETLQDAQTVIRDIVQKRQEDIDEFNNLPNTLMRGRRVGKIPTASSDTLETDREGDFNYDKNYLYICARDGAAITWRRIALSSW